MSLTLFQICDGAIIAAGTSDTMTSYVGNSDKQAKKVVSAVNEAVAQLRAAYNWEVLMTTKSATFTSSNYYALADDVEFIHHDSLVNISSAVRYKSITAERAAEIESNQIAANYDEVFIRSGAIKFMLPVTVGQTFEFKYQTNEAVVTTGNVTAKYFAVDSDTCKLNSDILVLLTAIILRDNEGSDSTVLRERFGRLYKRATGADAYRTKYEMFRRAPIWRR